MSKSIEAVDETTLACASIITQKQAGTHSVADCVAAAFSPPTPRPFHAWRCLLLRVFGAKIGKPAYVYPSARIWAPWNLVLGDHATISEQVDCYCVDKIKIGDFSTVSQYSFLCTASHDYLDPSILDDPCMPLVTAPISIGSRVWVTADVFVAPGVCINDGAVGIAREISEAAAGIVVPTDSPVALADAIEKFGSAKYRQIAGENGRRLVKESFSKGQFGESLSQVYEDMIMQASGCGGGLCKSL